MRSDCVAATAESGPHAHSHYFLVVFGFVGLGYLAAVGGVDAAPAPATGVARILARAHLGMATAKRGDLFLKRDRCDCPIPSAASGRKRKRHRSESKRRRACQLWLARSSLLRRSGSPPPTRGAKRISSHLPSRSDRRLVLNHRLYLVFKTRPLGNDVQSFGLAATGRHAASGSATAPPGREVTIAT